MVLYLFRNKYAFTLIELLLLLVIVGLVAGLTAPKLFNRYERIKTSSEEKQLITLIDKVAMLAFLQQQPITLKLSDNKLKLDSKKVWHFNYITFEDSLIHFNGNGFIQEKFLRYKLNGAVKTIGFQ